MSGHEHDRERRRGEREAVRPARTRNGDRDREARAAVIGMTPGTMPLVVGRDRVQVGPDEEAEARGRRPTTESRARRARRDARASPSSSASERKSAPCSVKSASVVRPANERVRVEQRRAALPVNSPCASIGTPCDDVRERDTPEQRGQSARPDEDRPVPARRASVAESRLPRYSNATPRTISATQDQEQREVEAREQRRVPAGEGGERRAAGDEQPHLVAVPHRADRVDQHRALVGVVGRRTAAACRRRSRSPRARSSRSRGSRSATNQSDCRCQ